MSSRCARVESRSRGKALETWEAAEAKPIALGRPEASRRRRGREVALCRITEFVKRARSRGPRRESRACHCSDASSQPTASVLRGGELVSWCERARSRRAGQARRAKGSGTGCVCPTPGHARDGRAAYSPRQPSRVSVTSQARLHHGKVERISGVRCRAILRGNHGTLARVRWAANPIAVVSRWPAARCVRAGGRCEAKLDPRIRAGASIPSATLRATSLRRAPGQSAARHEELALVGTPMRPTRRSRPCRWVNWCIRLAADARALREGIRSGADCRKARAWAKRWKRTGGRPCPPGATLRIQLYASTYARERGALRSASEAHPGPRARAGGVVALRAGEVAGDRRTSPEPAVAARGRLAYETIPRCARRCARGRRPIEASWRVRCPRGPRRPSRSVARRTDTRPSCARTDRFVTASTRRFHRLAAVLGSRWSTACTTAVGAPGPGAIVERLHCPSSRGRGRLVLPSP